jgi:hypothetical protein
MDADLELYLPTVPEQGLEEHVASLIMPSIKQQIFKAIRSAYTSISKDGPVVIPRTMPVLSTFTSATIGTKNGERALLTMVVSVHTTLDRVITTEDTQEGK